MLKGMATYMMSQLNDVHVYLLYDTIIGASWNINSLVKLWRTDTDVFINKVYTSQQIMLHIYEINNDLLRSTLMSSTSTSLVGTSVQLPLGASDFTTGSRPCIPLPRQCGNVIVNGSSN